MGAKMLCTILVGLKGKGKGRYNAMGRGGG